MKNLNLPNFLTALRIICIPAVYWLLDRGWVAQGMILLVFSLTLDYFDGKLARELGQTTYFGAVFDPVADKTVVLSYFSIIAYHTQLLPLWFVALTFTRNLSQLSVIPVLSWMKIQFQVKPKFIPKLATAMSFVLVILGMLAIPYADFRSMLEVKIVFIVLVSVSAILEWQVLVTFLPRYWQIAKGQHDTFE